MSAKLNGIGWQIRVHIVKTYGRQKMAAERWGVSQSFISALVTERKAPPAWLLDEMGLQRQVIYVPKEDSLW